MARIAIVGLGAIGCAIAAALSGNGRYELTLCARTGFDRLKCTGLGTDEIDLPANVTINARDTPKVDWVLVCVKAHQTAAIGTWLRGLVDARTKVAVLQNGVEHRARVAPLLPRGVRILPVIVQFSAHCEARGQVTVRSKPCVTVPDDDIGREFAGIFADTPVVVEPSDDFVSRVWEKLCLNAANGAITALTEQTIGVMRQPPIAELAKRLILECIAVGRAEGARLDDTLAEQLVERMAATPDAHLRGNSMYNDRMAGRELEYDARNGVVVRLGQVHGIATPVNATLVALLSAVSRRPPHA